MTEFHFRLLGRLHVRYDKAPIQAPDSRKACELLCYLLLYRERPHHRERLADLLWENGSATQSKKYLRQALWQLQSAFDGHQTGMQQGLVLADSTWVQLNPDIDFTLDVAEFESVCESVSNIPGHLLSPAQGQSLRSVTTLYQGDLLEGWYQDWCLFERVRLQGLYMAMLEKLMRCCEAQGEYAQGCSYGNIILRRDRARERTHRRMMRLYYQAGLRTAALRQYQACVKALQEELEVGPARSTRSLYEQIRADEYGREIKTSGHLPNPDANTTLDHLRQLDGLLGRVQNQVRACIQSLEEAGAGRD